MTRAATSVPCLWPASAIEDDGVATDPLDSISHHRGISGYGDLSESEHDWMDPVVEIEVELVD